MTSDHPILQQIFKVEQALYASEGLDWVPIEFHDNQACIDAIEGTQGIVDLLNEACKVQRGDDADWLTSLSNTAHLKSNVHFQLPKIRSPSFIVRHFAADVEYTVDGFMEKNMDALSERLAATVAEANVAFVADLIDPALIGDGAKRPAGRTVRKTVAGEFTTSLKALMLVLDESTVHYVRCIKPNDTKRAFCIDPRRTVQQLQACGVLETVRISAAGYPGR